MILSSRELQALLSLLTITAPEELDCEEFLAQLPRHLDLLREHRPTASEQPELLQHLQVCPECREEYDGLRDALDEGVL